MRKLTFLSFLVLLLAASCSRNPVADFSYPVPLKVGEDIQFNNLSKYANSFAWDFGDGHTSVKSDPVYAFATPGSHTVSLQAKGDRESSYTSKELQVSGVTYAFRNGATFDIPALFSFFWNGAEMEDFVEHGTLSMGRVTVAVITERSSVCFGIVLGDLVLVSGIYPLIPDKHNQITITDATTVYGAKGAPGSDPLIQAAFEARIKGNKGR
ncbi:MAG: PKD domain-containing protein [Bacteroidales bacterium]|jgi:PKD repeat protein|nr:PKD domain-containing protein [Bacteroidales bacterium]